MDETVEETKLLQVTIPEPLRRGLGARAAAEGLSLGAWCQRALESALDTAEPDWRERLPR